MWKCRGLGGYDKLCSVWKGDASKTNRRQTGDDFDKNEVEISKSKKK